MQRYRVRHNGLTCFIPPCFCWDLFDFEWRFQETISDIDLSQLQLEEMKKDEIIQMLAKGELIVEGTINHQPVPPKNLEGKILVIQNIIQSD
jgi:hypothetical protein